MKPRIGLRVEDDRDRDGADGIRGRGLRENGEDKEAGCGEKVNEPLPLEHPPREHDAPEVQRDAAAGRRGSC